MKGGAYSFPRIDGNGATMFLGKQVRIVEPQAGPLVHGFGRKKGIEDAGEVPFTNTPARILHRETRGRQARRNSLKVTYRWKRGVAGGA